MADLFFDTSALAKRYIAEVGSNWVKNICQPVSGNLIFIAEITTVEMTSAIVRRRNGGSLTASDASTAIAQFDADLLNEYFVLTLTSALLAEARGLAQTHGLRSLDAIQLSVAANLNHEQITNGLPPIAFISADNQLLITAQAEGLLTENPNSYP